MPMSEPRITVIIPTRERCETLGASIRTCIEQDYENLEIIVSDNASQDETDAVVRSFSDRRLRYIKTNQRLSMSSNFEFALRHAKPGLITFIGDDDGLMPGAVSLVAELFKQTGKKAIVSYPIDYGWPNHPFEKARNRMYIRRIGRRAECKESKYEVKRLLAFLHGGRNVNYWELPTIYRSFVSTEVIQAGFRDGRYFHSINPDIYSGFVNSFLIDYFLRIDRPLSIEGVSARSNGVSTSYGIDRSEETKFAEEADIPFHSDLVYSPSIHIAVAEAYLQARARFPEACKDHKFSIAQLCGVALRDTKGANRNRIVLAVNEILAKHQLSATNKKISCSKVTAAWQRFSELLNIGEVDCERFGVRDVYQASILAHYLLTQRHNGGVSWGATRLLKKLGQKICLK
jgi:glycosyltransferase involved in cell wall biosynthesis